MKVKFETMTDNDRQIVYCHIYYDNNIFTGRAICHPDDDDIFSEKFGQELAHKRATVKALKYIKSDLIKTIKVLEHSYHAIETNKEFDPNSFYARGLRKQIYINSAELGDINTAIAAVDTDIKVSIIAHNHLQEKIHHNRAK